MKTGWLVACLMGLGTLGVKAQTVPAPRAALGAVTVTATGDPVQKSYRRMMEGVALFEREHALAPDAQLRFRLLPRKPSTRMEDVRLELVGDSFALPIEVAADRTFTLPQDARGLREDAVVLPNRKRMSMTWRSEIRTPGLPPGTRRLGDLRLECRVGMQAGLVSNTNPVMDRINRLLDTPERYCGSPTSKYLFFAERPLFGVTLVHGARREALPIDRLYAQASDDPGLKSDLPFCDCEVLLDRTYYLPLGDTRWPDDTRVEFEWMEDAPP